MNYASRIFSAALALPLIVSLNNFAFAEEPKIGTVNVGLGPVTTKCEIRWGITKVKVFGHTITKTKVPKTYCGK